VNCNFKYISLNCKVSLELVDNHFNIIHHLHLLNKQHLMNIIVSLVSYAYCYCNLEMSCIPDVSGIRRLIKRLGNRSQGNQKLLSQIRLEDR